MAARLAWVSSKACGTFVFAQAKLDEVLDAVLMRMLSCFPHAYCLDELVAFPLPNSGFAGK
jgi:hypothetical protein